MSQDNNSWFKHPCAGREGWEMRKGYDDEKFGRSQGRRSAFVHAYRSAHPAVYFLIASGPTRGVEVNWTADDFDIATEAVALTEAWLLSEEPASAWLAAMERLEVQHYGSIQ